MNYLQLEKHINEVHSEMKTVIDKKTDKLWIEHKEEIYKKIANLLVDSEENRTEFIRKIQTQINKPSKKGRPKKKQNPWQSN